MIEDTFGPPVFSESAPAPELDGRADLVAPVAVRVIDLRGPLPDLLLSQARNQASYRSLLAIARLDGQPPVVGTFTVDPAGRVTRERLAEGLRRQLEAAAPERRVFGDDGLVLRPQRRPGARRAAVGVSVVIPTCNNPVALERCLRSVLASDYEQFEVIVVENRPVGSDTARMLAERFPGEERIRYLEEERPGASHARNAGLEDAAGDVIAFADDDVVVDSAWLKASVTTLETSPDVACVTGLILPLELESDSQLLMEQFAGFGKGLHSHVFRLDAQQRAKNPLLPYTPGAVGSGASVVVRADVVRTVGGFDPLLGPATPTTGGEDLDLFVRLLRCRQAIAYEPRAVVWHQHPDGMPRLRRQVYHYGVGLGAVLTKQLLLGPDRRSLLLAVPAGVRHLRDPNSRKNAGKRGDYPRYLTWLERLGMLWGPLAYVLSVLLDLVRPGGRRALRRPSAAPLRLWRRVRLPRGGAASVSRFEQRLPRNRVGAIPQAPLFTAAYDRAAALHLAAACAALAAPVAVAVAAPRPLRFALVLAFVLVAPGAALVGTARTRAEPSLAFGVSLGVSALVAQTMLWLGAWSPRPWLYGSAAACLAVLATRRLVLRRAAAAGGFVWRVPLWRLRLALVQRLSGRAAAHGAILVGALALWATSLGGVDLSHMGGLGLLNVLSPGYYLALVLLLGGLVAAAADGSRDPKLLGAYVMALIVVLHATTAILYDEPRYPWTYKHLGVINLIAATGRTDRQIDIYNNWPAFFAANAWLSKLSGLTPLSYAGWAQVFFNVLDVLAVRFAVRGFTRDERLLWCAAALFVLANWVGQDYLAPQAFAFLLSLVVIGIVIRWGRRRDRGAPLPLGVKGALAAGTICFVAVATTHQLSPVLLIATVAALALVARAVPLWVPAAMIAFEVWWLALAWPFVSTHFKLVDVGGGGSGTATRDLSAALPGARLGVYAPALVMAAIVALAAVGAVRRWRAGKRDLVLLCCVAAPALTVAGQSYGGEGVYRAFLFALPWLAFLGAAACASKPSPGRAPAIGPIRLAAAAAVLGACLLAATFAQELGNRISRDDVLAQTWYEQHAPAGALSVALAPSAPARLTARYPLVSLADPATLLEERGFTGHRLGAADVPRLEALLRAQGDHPDYVILAEDQEAYGRLNGLLPAGSVTGLVGALQRSPGFRLVYHRPTAWVFRYSSSPSQSASR